MGGYGANDSVLSRAGLRDLAIHTWWGREDMTRFFSWMGGKLSHAPSVSFRVAGRSRPEGQHLPSPLPVVDGGNYLNRSFHVEVLQSFNPEAFQLNGNLPPPLVQSDLIE